MKHRLREFMQRRRCLQTFATGLRIQRAEAVGEREPAGRECPVHGGQSATLMTEPMKLTLILLLTLTTDQAVDRWLAVDEGGGAFSTSPLSLLAPALHFCA